MPALQRSKEEKDFTAFEIAYVDAYTDPDNPSTFRNQIGAYRASGYSTNMPEQEQRICANRLVKREHIAWAIEKRLEKHFKRIEMSQQEAIARQSDAGRFDIGDCLEIHTRSCEHCGTVEDQAFIDIRAAKAKGLTKFIKSISYDKQGRQVVTFHDTMAAQDRILRASGAYHQRVNNGVNTLMSGFAAAMEAIEAIAKSNQHKELKEPVEVDCEVTD